MNFDYYARLSNEAAMAQNALSTAPHKSQAVVKTSSPKERGYSTIYLFDRPADRSKRTYVQALVADEFSDFQKNIIRDAFYGLGKVVGHEAYQNLIDDIRAGRSFTHPRDPNLPGPSSIIFPADYTQLTIMHICVVAKHWRWDPAAGDDRSDPQYLPYFIDSYDKSPDAGGTYEMGYAEINLLETTGSVHMHLNRTALDSNSFSSPIWSGANAHEMMHSAGWDHGDEATTPHDSFMQLFQEHVVKALGGKESADKLYTCG